MAEMTEGVRLDASSWRWDNWCERAPKTTLVKRQHRTEVEFRKCDCGAIHIRRGAETFDGFDAGKTERSFGRPYGTQANWFAIDKRGMTAMTPHHPHWRDRGVS